MSDEKRDVRAVVRTYFDKATNKDKNVYQTIGTAWVSPHESTITIQIDCLPLSKDWNGKLFINKPYDKKEDTAPMPKSVVTDAIYADNLPDMDKPISLSEIPF
jgi:hypothetical protein